jgi:hypothetical protein
MSIADRAAGRNPAASALPVDAPAARRPRSARGRSPAVSACRQGRERLAVPPPDLVRAPTAHHQRGAVLAGDRLSRLLRVGGLIRLPLWGDSDARRGDVAVWACGRARGPPRHSTACPRAARSGRPRCGGDPVRAMIAGQDVEWRGSPRSRHGSDGRRTSARLEQRRAAVKSWPILCEEIGGQLVRDRDRHDQHWDGRLAERTPRALLCGDRLASATVAASGGQTAFRQTT